MEEITLWMPRGRFGIAREGYPFLGISLILMALGLWFFWPLGVAFGVFFAFCLYFFRDPERTIPEDPRLLVSPADGKVLKVEALDANDLYSEPHQKISIFMSALNVHVNRAPCDGVVREVRYHPGKFFVASLDKASLHNERCSVILETPRHHRVAFTQIAGLVARRIVCYLGKNAQIRRGERYGLIRFGSRMEVSVPKSWKIIVQAGDSVRGGTSALAKMED